MRYVTCDKCNETVPMNSPEGIQFTLLTRFDIKDEKERTIPMSIDLCPKCTQDFQNWLNDYKTEL